MLFSPFDLLWAPVAFVFGSPLLFLALVAAVLFVAHRSRPRGRRESARPARRWDADQAERRIRNLEAILSRNEARRP